MRPVPNTRARDFRLYETQAILRYIDTLGPATAPALQPRDPHAAARMNQIVGIVDWYVFPTISVGITAELARLKDDAPFMTGDNVSIADLMLAPHLEFFRATPEGVDILSGTAMEGWLTRMSLRASMRATQAERLRKSA